MLELIGVLLDLVGSFWPLILALLGYLLFGKAARKGNQQAAKWGKWIGDVTDIPFGSDAEEPKPKRMMVKSKPAAETDVSYKMYNTERLSVDRTGGNTDADWVERATEPTAETTAETLSPLDMVAQPIRDGKRPDARSMKGKDHPILGKSPISEGGSITGAHQKTALRRQERSREAIDPREGLKWALVFSPPRAKAAYRPPYRSDRTL
ncbi:hypothetical protein LOK74_12075 [Brevibacillus humidisoli]|uniref:hypothetical protein n=1 Tax=Brevibacillus humidisoli TaxID=2895522 RepID=UPI001E4916D3|nr:hypothetical protein [Brevibacillus humidisoli]UFJ43153.1 hypothetical protein LOK74_12075 [Brevibacillus humidisoli]